MALHDVDLKYKGKALTTGKSLSLTSSSAGGENTSDSTSRINLYSHQKAQHFAADGTTYAHFGEVLRIYSRKNNSKQMIAWYGPTSYNGSGDPATADTAWFWMGAHYDPNDPGPAHGHWSVESPDLAGDLQTRFEIRIWDPTTGVFGMNRTIAKFNAADVVVAQDNGALYMAASAGTNKNLYFTNDQTVVSDVSSTGKRWGIQANGTTEAGSNVGTDFQINRYNDSGAFTDAALFIKRSTGQVGIGAVISPLAKLDVSAAGSYHTVQSTQTTTSSVVYAAYSGILGLATNKLFDGRVSGDANGRLVVYGDGKHEWGDGTNNRDTNLYRGSADTLQTDNSFVVGVTLRAPTIQGSISSGQTLTLRSTSHATKGTINIGASQWNDGTNVLLMGNTTAAPSSNPTGGGYLYVEAGALKFRGSSGTVTTIAPA